MLNDPQNKQRLFPLTAVSVGLYNREAMSRLRGWNQLLVYSLDHVSSTRGPPTGITRPAATFLNCVYTLNFFAII